MQASQSSSLHYRPNSACWRRRNPFESKGSTLNSWYVTYRTVRSVGWRVQTVVVCGVVESKKHKTEETKPAIWIGRHLLATTPYCLLASKKVERMTTEPLPVPAQLKAQLDKCKSIRSAETHVKSRIKTPMVRNTRIDSITCLSLFYVSDIQNSL